MIESIAWFVQSESSEGSDCTLGLGFPVCKESHANQSLAVHAKQVCAKCRKRKGSDMIPILAHHNNLAGNLAGTWTCSVDIP